MATLSGRVYKPLYSKDGFFIFSFDVLAVEDSPFNDKATTVKGLLPGLIQLRSEVPLKVHGKWTTHKKHGR